MTREIQLTQGFVALVDDEDFERISARKWCAEVNRRVDGSARVCAKCWDGKGHRHMHRIIMGATKGQMVDHINGDALDNRKANLRICDRSQNNMNSRARTVFGGDATASGFKGVFLNKNTGKWRARIRRNGRLESLGTFGSEVEAAQAYDKAAREAFGEFARTNF